MKVFSKAEMPPTWRAMSTYLTVESVATVSLCEIYSFSGPRARALELMTNNLSRDRNSPRYWHNTDLPSSPRPRTHETIIHQRGICATSSNYKPRYRQWLPAGNSGSFSRPRSKRPSPHHLIRRSGQFVPQRVQGPSLYRLGSIYGSYGRAGSPWR
jgi:hypothetical protein